MHCHRNSVIQRINILERENKFILGNIADITAPFTMRDKEVIMGAAISDFAR